MLGRADDRKSVSAEINWGVRFENDEQAARFIEELADEVSKRLRAIARFGRTITLKVNLNLRVLPDVHSRLL